MNKKNISMIFLMASMLFIAGIGLASAGVVFDGSPGTSAPPATLGPYTMTPFSADPSPEGTVLSSIPSPISGSLGFAGDVQHLKVPTTWNNWGHGYTGDVYWTQSATSLTLTMPPGTGAFYLYSEANLYSTFTFTATTDDGTTSGPVTVTTPNGATYFGFYCTAGSHISTITVNCLGGTDPLGFAVGEFGIARRVVVIPKSSLSGLLNGDWIAYPPFSGHQTYFLKWSDPGLNVINKKETNVYDLNKNLLGKGVTVSDNTNQEPGQCVSLIKALADPRFAQLSTGKWEKSDLQGIASKNMEQGTVLATFYGAGNTYRSGPGSHVVIFDAYKTDADDNIVGLQVWDQNYVKENIKEKIVNKKKTLKGTGTGVVGKHVLPVGVSGENGADDYYAINEPIP